MKFLSHKLLLTIILIPFPGHVKSQQTSYLQFLDHPWVDSVLASLSMDERIAQSIWISTGSEKDISQFIRTDHIIRQYGIGGLIINSGCRDTQARLINHFQSVSKVPLAIALEDEWGPYPNRLSLEAIRDDSLKYHAGSRMAEQLNGRGIHAFLSPVADLQLAAGFQDNHILLCDDDMRDPEISEFDSILMQVPGFQSLVSTGTSNQSVLAGSFRWDDMVAVRAIGQIKSLIGDGIADEESISSRTRMILAFKYWSGLQSNSRKIPVSELAFIRDLYKNSLTVLNNRNRSIPIEDLAKNKIACVAINHSPGTAFQDMVSNYTRSDHYSWFPGGNSEDSLLTALASYDIVLAGIYNTDQQGIDNEGMEPFLSLLSKQTRLLSVVFGNPAIIDRLEGLFRSDGLVLAYEHNTFTEELAAQLLFGGIGGKGILPVSINEQYPEGFGMNTAGGFRLQYAYPENAGVSSQTLIHKIDSIVFRGLEAGAYPGCEVMAARRGMVIFHKTYGYHTFDSRINVQKQDLYDLASVTKVSGPLPGLMLLEGMGKFSHRDRLGDYAPAMKGSDKADLELKDILAHQAGLYPYLIYWKNTVKKNWNYKRRLIRNTPSEKFSIQVADRVYLKSDYRKKIYREIRKSSLGGKEYSYSGLSFLLYPEIIEDLSGERYEDFLSENIYHPLGAWDLVFNPCRFYPKSRIAPTEIDTLFRRQLVHGYVHDEAAAFLGGYSGNAGLFSTANDLMKLFEMYRRMGNYGGAQILNEEVLKQYTSCQFPENKNRRGLGFDKPSLGERDGTKDDYPCPGASPSSFGHSGFTGTFAWADPEHEITYVFLCNRVYPTRDNNLIARMNIRTAILQSIYDSIINQP